jgi:hypothetical protein
LDWLIDSFVVRSDLAATVVSCCSFLLSASIPSEEK